MLLSLSLPRFGWAASSFSVDLLFDFSEVVPFPSFEKFDSFLSSFLADILNFFLGMGVLRKELSSVYGNAVDREGPADPGPGATIAAELPTLTL